MRRALALCLALADMTPEGAQADPPVVANAPARRDAAAGPATSADAAAARLASTASACVRAAVLVTVDGSTGSGTVIDPAGYVLTNFHVIAPVFVPGFDGPSIRAGAHVRIQLPDPATFEALDVYEADVVAADRGLDLALLRVLGRPDGTPAAGPFDALDWRGSGTLSLGQEVSVLGYPFGHRILTVLRGTITGRREEGGEVEWVTTDAPFNPGNSGGSVVDAQCRLVGVPTQVFRGGLNPVSMARPLDARVREFVRVGMTAPSRRALAAEGAALGPRSGSGTKPAERPRRRR